MKNVFEFPQDKQLRAILDERKEELETVYNTLSRAYGLINELEERVDGLENEYNHFLRRYSQSQGGIENVEVGYLEYGSAIEINSDTGTIVFTPWDSEMEDDKDDT